VTTADPTAEETKAVVEVTSHHGRLYALALALVVFFLAWAVVAARPWATASADPRLRTLAVRQAQLQHEAKLVRQVVAARWAKYRVELKARQAQIARVKAATAAAAAAAVAAPVASSASAGPVQVVNLPPAHVVTRTS
jgi:pyruvate/2-oxoglutarate dehydrogenase complex dihydrolipoamide acyltransferase (E2) component